MTTRINTIHPIKHPSIINFPVTFEDGIVISGGSDTGVPGSTWYDPNTSSLNVRNEYADSVLQVGQELYVQTHNNTGATLSDGTIVYLHSFYGNHKFNVAKAQADSLDTAKILGVVTTSMDDGDDGLVTVFGGIHNLDTSGEISGSPVYLSDTVAGGWTTAKPDIPIRIGFIGYIDSSNGSILVNIDEAPPSIYGTFALAADKTFSAINTSEIIPFDTEIAVKGIGHSTSINPEEITILSSGTYVISAGFHINRVTGASSRDFVAWLEIDVGGAGSWVAVPNTAVRSSVYNAGDTLRFAASMAGSFSRNDKLRVRAQVTDTNIILNYITASGDIPSQISAGFRINRVGD